MLDLATGQTTQVGAHDQPIKVTLFVICIDFKSVRFVDGTAGLQNCIVTGSWDKTLKFWDLRASAPVATVQLAERVYAMDVVFPLVNITVNRFISSLSLQQLIDISL